MQKICELCGNKMRSMGEGDYICLACGHGESKNGNLLFLDMSDYRVHCALHGIKPAEGS